MNHVNRMKSYSLKRPSVAIYAFGGLLTFALSMAQAAPMTFQALAQRLPTTTNAVVAVNVTKVLQSPYGKREHWAEIAADAWAKQPVMIPLSR